jgi:hypothetical protein
MTVAQVLHLRAARDVSAKELMDLVLQAIADGENLDSARCLAQAALYGELRTDGRDVEHRD